MDTPTEMRLSKVLLIVFTVIQIVMGVNFGFVKIVKKKWRLSAKLLNFSCSLVLLVMLIFYCVKLEQVFFCVWYSMEYSINIVILMFAKTTFCDFVVHYADVDTSLKLEGNSLNGIVLLAMIFPITVSLFKMLMSFAYCAWNTDYDFCRMPLPEYAKTSLVMLAMDMTVVFQFVVIYTCYKRTSILKTKLAKCEISVDQVVNIYKNIFDGLDKMKPTINKLMISSLGFSTPKYMVIIYMALHSLKIKKDWPSFAIQYIILAQASCMSALPAITAEMVNSEVDSIKLTLHNFLIETSERKKRSDIKNALRYLYGRPSQYYLWRRVPVDLRLIGLFMSIVSTYLIVIIQFTHLYD